MVPAIKPTPFRLITILKVYSIAQRKSIFFIRRVPFKTMVGSAFGLPLLKGGDKVLFPRDRFPTAAISLNLAPPDRGLLRYDLTDATGGDMRDGNGAIDRTGAVTDRPTRGHALSYRRVDGNVETRGRNVSVSRYLLPPLEYHVLLFELSDMALFGEAVVISVSDDDMVEDLDIHHPGGEDEVSGDLVVLG